MDIFEKKVNFNPTRIYRMISRQLGQDINGLSEPCYKIHTKKFEAELYREMRINPKDLRDLAKRTYEGTKFFNFDIAKVPFTIALAYIYYRFAKARKKQIAEAIMIYTIVKHYGSSSDKAYPKVCLPDTFRYALSNLTKTHLFYREKTVANAIIHIGKAMNEKKYSIMDLWEPEKLYRFIIDGRTWISQSVKSFANTYYRAAAEGKTIGIEKTAESPDEQNMFQTTTGSAGKQAAIEKFVKNMFVYKNHDRDAVNEAKRLSRVKNNIAESVIPVIHDKSSEENVKIILTSFLKEVLDSRGLCEQEFYRIVKKLMMKRNYKDTFQFRNLVVGFTNNVYEAANPISSKNLTQRDMISLSIFVAYYVTISFRNLFCVRK